MLRSLPPLRTAVRLHPLALSLGVGIIITAAASGTGQQENRGQTSQDGAGEPHLAGGVVHHDPITVEGLADWVRNFETEKDNTRRAVLCFAANRDMIVNFPPAAHREKRLVFRHYMVDGTLDS